MATISGCVKRIVQTSPFIGEMLSRNILSYSNYADLILPDVKKQLEKPVSKSAVVMALRRYADELRDTSISKEGSRVDYQIVMKTNIFDINMVRRDQFISRLGDLYSGLSLEQGDFLNISLGSNEVSLAVSDKYRPLVERLTEKETILHRMEDLVACTLIFTGEFLQTPGIVYEAVRRLAWEKINMVEIISTMNELTFVISRENSMKAFSVLQSFLSSESE